MQTIDRWRKWRPSDEIISAPLEQAPPKPSKATSGGFEGAMLGTAQIISAPAYDPATGSCDPLDDLRPPFVAWFDAQVWLDAEASALRISPRWSTTVNAMHRDCCRWMSPHHPILPTRDQFLCLLQELGCTIRVISELYVDHVGLNEDVKAKAQFSETAPNHLQATPAAAATDDA
jgi:hypothetical protein